MNPTLLSSWHEVYKNWLHHLNLSSGRADTIYNVSIIILTFLVAFLAYKAAMFCISLISRKIKQNSPKRGLINALIHNKIPRIVSFYAPLLVVRYNLDIFFPRSPDLVALFTKLYQIAHVLLVVYLFNALLNTFIEVYQYKEENKTKPIKGFVQFSQIIIVFLAVIVIISILMNVKAIHLLSGLGAASAILMLIFKDSITGLIAGIQISFNQMIKIGDWIEVPKYNVDGEVTDITLTSVKVQNWDKTISTVPTYNLIVSDSVKNWSGMTEYGARRIARSVNIDMQSVHICTPEMLKRFKKIGLVADYIDQTEKSIREYNEANRIENTDATSVNGRQQTNLGIFRAYLYEYLKKNEGISDTSTLIVRQLQPGPTGIPLQIYCFTKTTAWAVYEDIQSDIFDHVLAVVPFFDLKVFQSPSGKDLGHYIAAAVSQENQNR